MRPRKPYFIVLFVLSAQAALARPLLTEPVSTLGRATFEAGAGVSVRHDTFNFPKTEYNTVVIPFRARLGFGEKWDVGFSLTHLSHDLKTNNLKLKGSRPALFSPEIKVALNKNVGLLSIWHLALKEKPEQNLPIARGDDHEFLVLFEAPTRWPASLNVGYVFKGDYETRFGVEGGPQSRIGPGDIFETRAALEIPMKHGFSILTESSYYIVGKRKINGISLPGSEGEALDLLLGFTWGWKGWNIGTGASFGLLDESHTSFDLERGAGDVTYHLSLSYKLKARKPYQ